MWSHCIPTTFLSGQERWQTLSPFYRSSLVLQLNLGNILISGDTAGQGCPDQPQRQHPSVLDLSKHHSGFCSDLWWPHAYMFSCENPRPASQLAVVKRHPLTMTMYFLPSTWSERMKARRVAQLCTWAQDQTFSGEDGAFFSTSFSPKQHLFLNFSKHNVN
jgi:hypothetical protein